ncbi:MAG TPA: hydroxymethylbilane synthase [Candidatus Dormibacteraeota bacterium]|nr:hydroxymethylbilane synthase [Candidatus Dormibacteraeota bacterium]
MRVRIATRGSKLAMIQAQLAADALGARYPENEFLLQPLRTHGDRHPTLRLSESPREGVFVKELERALLDGNAELAVHSAKDLPTLSTPGLTLAAFLPRADARDVLISRNGAVLTDLAAAARVGTGSPRRAAQIAAIRPDLVAVEIRGNVDTRLRKLEEGVVDALILAAAGLMRLGRLGEATQILPFEVMLPAPGQGALVVQAVEGSESAVLAQAVDDAPTSRAVLAERGLLRRLGGGCLSALGAYAVIRDAGLVLQAVLLDESGRRVVRAEAAGGDDAAVVAEVARQLEAGGAHRLLTSRAGPLSGLRVMVTRADRQAAPLVDALRAQGATVVSCPVIEIEPLEIDRARLSELARYDWLILTSANGVERLFDLLAESQLEFPAHIKVAVIGPETAAELRRHGVEPALVPEEFVAESLAEALRPMMAPGSRVLLARAAGSREALPDRLRANGARVDVLETYRAVPPAELPARLAATLPEIDLVTFTSSSTVRHFVDAAGSRLPPSVAVACIGPITAQTARELGLRVDIIAQEYTARGLVEAIVRSRSLVST